MSNYNFRTSHQGAATYVAIMTNQDPTCKNAKNRDGNMRTFFEFPDRDVQDCKAFADEYFSGHGKVDPATFYDVLREIKHMSYALRNAENAL